MTYVWTRNYQVAVTTELNNVAAGGKRKVEKGKGSVHFEAYPLVAMGGVQIEKKGRD